MPALDVEALVRDYARPIHAYLWRLLRDPSAAEDCLQDAFLQAAASAAKGERIHHPRAWLYAVATNAANSYGRRLARGREREQAMDSDLPDHASGVPEAAERRERLRRVDEAVRRLPAKQRAALVMRKYQELSYPEIGVALGCSAASARANVYQALRRLRTWLEEVDA
ncbi:MAG TPA: sigma-70 family RNA polymerase sigma factor [Anaerolineales bacterium]|nr:sigma-70 family RNA polymerase sigma factor [Anaerolineales bacterium]